MANFRVAYWYNGNYVSYESGSFPAGTSKTLDLPIGSCCANLYVENLVFIATWRRIFSFNFEVPFFKCYNVWGTTLNPGWAEEGC